MGTAKTVLLLCVCATLLVGLSFFGLVYSMDCTQYSSGYSESKFKTISVGMTEFQVKQILGEPFQETKGFPGVYRYYGPEGSVMSPGGGLHCPGADHSKCCIIKFNASGTIAEGGGYQWIGKTPNEISTELGSPIDTQVWQATRFLEYTIARPKGDYYKRRIGIDQSGRVVEIVAYYYHD